MTDKKAEKILQDEADAIVSGSRESILAKCGVKEKQKPDGKPVLKILSVAAAVVFIAAIAYICYLPIYMSNHGLLPAPASSDTGTAATPADTSQETGGAAAEGGGIIKIEEYMKDFPISGESDDPLERLYIESCRLCFGGDIILVPDTFYTRSYLQYTGKDAESMRYDDGHFFVEATLDPAECYLVFLSSVELFDKYYVDADPYYTPGFNRNRRTCLYFETCFEEYGYGSYREFIDAKTDVTGAPPYQVEYAAAMVCFAGYTTENFTDKWYAEALKITENNNGEFYYGCFNGCSVKLIPGQLCVNSALNVGGFNFLYPSSFTITAERGGVEYDLREAYSKGYLFDEHLAEIYWIHRNSFDKNGLYYEYDDSEKDARYLAGLEEILNSTADKAEQKRLIKELYQSIYSNSAATVPDERDIRYQEGVEEILNTVSDKATQKEMIRALHKSIYGVDTSDRFTYPELP